MTSIRSLKYFITFGLPFLAGTLCFSPLQAANLCPIVHIDGQIHSALKSTKKAIVALADNELIPPEVLQNSSLDEVAEGVVARVRDRELIYKDQYRDDPKVDLKNEADIILFFPIEQTTAIKNSGFRNQHEVGHSQGDFDPPLRRKVEDAYTGIKLGTSKMSQSLRPKSAFINIRTPLDLGRKSAPSIRTYGYGGIGAVLKNSVKSRALWTFDDSATVGLSVGETEEKILTKYRGTFDRGSISIADDLQEKHKTPFPQKFGTYYEAVIFGNLDFSDVEYFIVEHKYYADFLVSFGKPIYQSVMTYQNGRTVFQKGELLFDGRRLIHPDATIYLSQLLESSGAGSVSGELSGWVSVSHYAALSKVSNKTSSAYILSPSPVRQSMYKGFLEHFKNGSRILNKLGIRTKSIVAENENFAILSTGEGELLMNELSAARKAIAINELIKVIERLVDQKVLWVVDPAMLLLNADETLTVLGFSRYSNFEYTSLDILDEYERSLEHTWDKYFSVEQIQPIRAFLQQKRKALTRETSETRRNSR